MLFAASPSPTSAQSADTLISTSGQAQVASSGLVRAQGFTTGSNVHGYTLDSVELYLDNVPATGVTEALVTLHAHDTGAPGELVATFTNPEAPLAGANTFAAPDDAVLAAETTYFLVVNLEAVTRYAFGLADPPQEEAQPSSGWSVAELSSSLAGDGIWSADESHTLRFTLNGVVNDTPPSTLLPWLTLGGIALLEALQGRDPAPSAPTPPPTVPPTTPTAPDQVTGVTVMSAVESLAVSWTAVSDADGYKVQWKSGDETFEGGGAREHVIGAGSTTAYTIPDLTAGTEYTIRVIATRTGAEDGVPSAEVTGTPRALSADAALSALRVIYSDGMAIALTPMFASAQTDYSAPVGNAVARITIVPTPSDTNARVEFLDANDMALADADDGVADFQADLAVGANTVKVKVTAENGVAMATYTLSIRRAVGAPDQVMTIRVLPGPEALIVLWDEVSDADGYKVQWKSGDETFEGGGAREHVIGAGSTTAYTIPDLTAGTEYTIRVIATRTGAEDGVPSAEVTGTPRALSADAALSALRVIYSDGMAIALTPMFASAQTDYSAPVGNAVARITIVPTPSDTNARVEFLDANDMALADADDGVADFQADLAVGANTVKVKVTAENGVAMATYTLSIRRAVGAPDQVMTIRVLPGPEALIVLWDEVSDADGYKVQWKSGDETFEGGGAREHVIGAGSTTAYTIPDLTAGTEYTIRVIATRTGAEDGVPSAEVTGTPRALSADAALSALRVIYSDGMAIALTPMFASAQTDYSAPVGNAVARITIVPTPSDTNARVEFLDANDMALADADDGVADFQADLAVGANTVKVKVTAENGVAMATYTLSIRRAVGAPDQVMTIRVLPGPEALIVLWDEVSDADGYKVQWKSGDETFEGGGAREHVIGAGSTTAYTIPDLTAGTEYTIRVIATRTGAEDGVPSAEVTGTPRALSADAALSALRVIYSDGMAIALTPMFASAQTDYSAPVGNAVARITIVPTPSDTNARVEFLDANDMALADADDGVADFQADLAVGANTVKVKVTAENGVAMATYTLSIRRAVGAPDQVMTIRVLPGPEALIVLWDEVSDADGYKVQWKSGDETFEGGGAREHVIGAGSTTAYTIPDLTAGTEYTIRVIATRTGAEDGVPSAEVTGTPRALSADAALSALRVIYSDGMAIALTPMFASAQTDYSAPVGNAVARITIVPTPSDTNARVEFLDANDMALADADDGVADFQADLAVGANTVKVKVTAENGVAMATYTLSIRRAVGAPDQVMTIRVLPGPEALIVLWDEVSDADGYKVQWKSGDETFEGGGAREHVIGAGSTTAYTIPDLTAGTEYTIRVIATRTGAEDGVPSAEVTGTPRALSADAALSALRVIYSDGMAIALTPMFASAQTDYSAPVGNAVARITIVPTPSDTNARVEFLDANDMALADADDGVADFQADLAVGANTVKVKVTAENGVAMATYTLSIRRAVGAPDQVMTIRVLPGPEALIVLWDEVSDADGYKVQWKSGKEAFESGGDREGLVNDGGKTIHTILHLAAGTEYTVRVIATRSGAEDGLPSNEAKGTPYAPSSEVTRADSDGGDGSGPNTGGALTDLEVTDPNGMEVTLNPAFASSRRSYTASVANTAAWVTFKPSTGDPDATVRYEDAANQQLTDADGNRSDFQVNLEEGANTVRLRVTTSGATTPQTYTVIVTRGTANLVENNNPPTFSTNTATRSFRENVGDTRSTGEDVGAPVTADDTDNDTLNYTLEGPDEARFEIGSLNGQIRTRSRTNYDRESDSSHAVTVRASDGRGGSDTIAVTIDVTDVEELPLTPGAPTVSAVSGSTTSVSVAWTTPDNTARPRIASYDLQYKKSTETEQDWKDGPQNRTGTSATISSLDASTDYDVQVRATNVDGDGPWSGTGTGKTARPGNRAPDFGATSAIREFQEDVGDADSSGEDVGAPVTATDLDNDSVTYTLEGSDAASFEIIPTSGQIRTLSGTNYDREADSSYSVRVKATDTEGGNRYHHGDDQRHRRGGETA